MSPGSRGWQWRQRLMQGASEKPMGPPIDAKYATAAEELADILYTAWRPGGLANAKEGKSTPAVLGRLLAGYDRYYPAVQDVDGRAIADLADDPATTADDGWGTLKAPVLYFGATGMGVDWLLNGIASAGGAGSPDVTINVLEGYGHLDVVVGDQARARRVRAAAGLDGQAIESVNAAERDRREHMRNTSQWVKGALAAALLVALPAVARAQATGTISGVVTDPTGAVLPGATVEATSAATGQVRTAVTGPEGFYTVPLVSPGRYEVKASLAGFQSATRTNVQVSVSETARANLTLPVGSVTENVTIVGEPPLVETANATLGIVIDEKKIVDLPLNGRNFTQLGTLIPGVVAQPADARRRHR